MNSYSHFNNWVYSYYRNRNLQSDQGTFAIDLDIYTKENNISKLVFADIRFGTWSKLLQLESNEIYGRIPRYFGLIALQCHAAFMMENDGTLHESVYRKRLVEIAHLGSETELDVFFREPFLNRPVQEQIWERAARHFKELGIYITLPAAKTGSNRFVQYPKSQVVLNKEDLKEYIPLFREIDGKVEQISIWDFQSYLRQKYKDYISLLKRPNNRVREDDMVRTKIRYSQIFNFYCSNWEDSHVQQLKAKVKPVNEFAIAFLEDGVVRLFDASYKPFDIGRLLEYPYLFFRKTTYPGDYELQNSLCYDEEFLICFSDGNNLPIKGEPVGFDHPRAKFIKITLTRLEQYGTLSQFIYDTFPIRVVGLRNGRRRQFLYGIGPHIICDEEDRRFELFRNGTSIGITIPDTLSLGQYRIQTRGFNDFCFEVTSPIILNKPILSNGSGKSLSNFMQADNGDRVEGMCFEIEEAAQEKHSINSWIKRQHSMLLPTNYSEALKKILCH